MNKNVKYPENTPQWLKDAEISDNAKFSITIRFGIEWVLWESGTFMGGEFRGGYFMGGEFRGGYFMGGEFRGGIMCVSSKWYIGLTFEGKIKIGCKEKTVKEWDLWFKSKEEFTTKRNTPEFKRIYANYRAVREYKLTLDKK